MADFAGSRLRPLNIGRAHIASVPPAFFTERVSLSIGRVRASAAANNDSYGDDEEHDSASRQELVHGGLQRQTEDNWPAMNHGFPFNTRTL
jgi:hypothetical protein